MNWRLKKHERHPKVPFTGHCKRQLAIKLREAGDSALQSAAWATMRDVIERDPMPFLMALDIQLQAPQKKLRTMAQIFTSKGKGKAKEANPIGFTPAEKGQTLCSVGFTPKAPPPPAPKAPPPPAPKPPAPAMPVNEIEAAAAPFLETVRIRDSDLDPARFHDGDYCPPPPPAPRRQKLACEAALMALNDRQVRQMVSLSVRAK